MNANRFSYRVHKRLSAFQPSANAGDFHKQGVTAGKLPVYHIVPQPVGRFLRYDQNIAAFRGRKGIRKDYTGGFVPAFGKFSEYRDSFA